MFQRDLRRLDAMENRRRYLANVAGYAANRDRPTNTTVQLLSSSSDDDDSPRIDPSARTPPYLLPSRKRPMGSYGTSEAKRRRFRMAASSSTFATSTGRSTSIIIDDDDNQAIERREERYQGSVLPFSPAPRSSSVESIDLFERGAPSTDAVSASSADGGTTPMASSPSVGYDPAFRSPALAYSPAAYSPDQWSPNYGTSPQFAGSDSTSDGGRNSYAHFNRSSPAYAFRFSNWGSQTPRSRSSDRLSDSPERRDRWDDGSDDRPTTISSRASSPIDPDEIQIVAELKPKYLRTPELVTLHDDAGDEADRKPNVASVVSIADDGPSTSGTRSERDRSSSKDRKRHKHRDHKSDRHRHRHRSHKKSKKEKKHKREKSKRRHRDRDRDGSRDRDRVRDRDRERNRDRDWDRDRERNRDREREQERERAKRSGWRSRSHSRSEEYERHNGRHRSV